MKELVAERNCYQEKLEKLDKIKKTICMKVPGRAKAGLKNSVLTSSPGHSDTHLSLRTTARVICPRSPQHLVVFLIVTKWVEERWYYQHPVGRGQEHSGCVYKHSACDGPPQQRFMWSQTQ